MIVLITRSFPIGGEPFLIDEIKYLNEALYFFPINETDDQKENIPDNVWLINKSGKRIKEFFCLLSGLFDICFYQELKTALCGKNKIKKVFVMCKFYGTGKYLSTVLRKKLQKENSDRVIIYSYWMQAHALAAAFFKRSHPSVMFVTRCHRYDLYEERAPYQYLPFRQMIIKYADGIFPISNDGKEYLISHYKVDNEKVIVSRLGSSDYGFKKHIKGKCLHITSCSLISQIKRVDKIVDALSIVDAPFIWTHYGDGELLDSIERKCGRLLKKDTYRLAGAVEHGKLMNLYIESEIDVFINVSESEGIPVSIMEAMSFGIPVIATDVGGTSEIVTDGFNGFLLEENCSKHDISDAINRIIQMSQSDYQLLRENARKTWENQYSAEKNYISFAENIEKTNGRRHSENTLCVKMVRTKK